MGSTLHSNERPPRRKRSEGGVALFMVIMAMTILSILVTEFTYVSQVNQRMAFDGFDQVKAHYLAKSALKLSLLRLKAYQNLRQLGKGSGGGAGGGIQIPAFILDKIWSFPLMFPIPSNIPGLSLADKDRINEFQNKSGLDGRFTVLIESESSKYNINMILGSFSPPPPSPSPSPSGATPTPNPNPTPVPAPTATAGTGPAAFNKDEARKQLGLLLQDIVQSKFEADPDFATEYRDLRVEDLLDNLAAWADWSYESRLFGRDNPVPPKRMPFFSTTELHMLPLMDDKLYDLIAPAFTAQITTGINVNKIQEPVLRSLIPRITEEEVKKFFEYRDDPVEDHLFKKEDEFFNYLKGHINIFRNDDDEVRRYKETLEKRNIRIILEENEFKITVQAQVRQATKLLEAWVTLGTGKPSTPSGGSPTPTPAPGAPPPPLQTGTAPAQKPDAGLKVLFMRIL